MLYCYDKFFIVNDASQNWFVHISAGNNLKVNPSISTFVMTNGSLL